jgi:methanol---5-hydroxybenzimidazolylcobamide Co-methyltransferase
MKCGELMLGDAKLKLTAFEKESLNGYMKDLKALPDKEGDFIDMCLKKYAKVKGFVPAAYGL